MLCAFRQMDILESREASILWLYNLVCLDTFLCLQSA